MKKCRDDIVYELAGAGVRGPRGIVLDSLECTIRERATTVLLGPSGTGKSALLRAMSGRPPSEGWSYRGTWNYRGVPLRTPDADGELVRNLVLVPQRRAHRYEPSEQDMDAHSWREALASGARTVLLDEPMAGAPREEEMEELVRALSAHSRQGAAIVVTHNLALARRTADDVLLLVAGGIVEQGSAASFFARPATELGRRFLQQGNCWPSRGRGVPELPSHFKWVIPERLGGMGSPGLLGCAEDDLAALRASGIKLLVSLTEERLPPELLRSHEIQCRHFPIPDMGVPALGPTARLCGQIARTIERGDGVAVHCRAGLGRTGTILAAVLVWLGRDAESAIREVRAIRRSYIQNDAQLGFVKRFADSV